MRKQTKAPRSAPVAEIQRLRARLEEAEETLDAIRSGKVDALVVSSPAGDRIFTLDGPEHRYRRLVETMKEGAGIVARDGTLLYCNRQLAEMLSASLERLIGGEVIQHVAPVSRKTFDALARQADDGEPAKAEVSFRLPAEGETVTAYVSMSRTGDADGSLCLVATDLTEQKRGEEIVAAERLATSILDQAAEAVIVCDPRGHVVRASQSAHRIALRNPLLARFEDVFPLRSPSAAVVPVQLVAAALAGESTTGIDASLPRPHGETLHLIASAAPLTNAAREIVGCVVSLVDITQRKRAEDAVSLLSRAGAALGGSLDLDDMLARLTRELVPGFADACMIYLATGDDSDEMRLAAVRHVRPPKEALYREEARCKGGAARLYERVAAGGRPELIDQVTAELLDRISVDGTHREILRTLRPLSAAAAPLRAVRHVFGAIVLERSESDVRYTKDDLATLEQLALRLAMAIDNSRLLDIAQRERARVEEANRAKDEFLAAVSHELRTPLNAILGWARMLKNGKVAEDKRPRAIETIERNAAIQTQLIEDLLDISRIVTGKLRIHSRPLDMASVIQAAVESVKPQADAKRVTVLASLGAAGKPVLGDGDRLQQVVWNLLTNAIKFTPVGGHVRVRLTAADGHAELTVSDDGEGISAEFLPHVFERFQQAMGGSARAHGGLGIGLTIVKNLVELHGGTIRATSDGQGHGSTFVVVLPTLAEIDVPGEVAPPEPVRESLADLTGLRVLAVEDDVDSRELLATVLGQSGAVAHAAASAAEAFTLFTAGTFDVLVSDIGLPGEDGYGLISRIRTLSPAEGGRIPAVALTAFARGDDRTRALRAGFDMHLPKPVEPAELVAVLGNLTGRRR